MGGITRVHGNLIAPKNFAGVALQDFTLTVGGTTATLGTQIIADLATPTGALDQIFKTAASNIASLSRVGTVSTSTKEFSIRFAIEALGVDANSPGYLGTGPDNAGAGDAEATTALALQAAIRSLTYATTTVGGTIHLTTATVTAFTY